MPNITTFKYGGRFSGWVIVTSSGTGFTTPSLTFLQCQN